MKAVCWMGKGKLETLNVADPTILNPQDAIIKFARTAICGSDLHLYDGFIPTMEAGDILGHEFMGLVEEVGKKVTNLKRGDRKLLYSELYRQSKQIDWRRVAGEQLTYKLHHQSY